VGGCLIVKPSWIERSIEKTSGGGLVSRLIVSHLKRETGMRLCLLGLSILRASVDVLEGHKYPNIVSSSKVPGMRPVSTKYSISTVYQI
jgi:hypothetical protein